MERANLDYASFDMEAYMRRTVRDFIPTGTGEYRIPCFYKHGCNGTDTSYHLYVNTDKKCWVCFRCGFGDNKQTPGTASLIKFIAGLENVSYAHAANIIATDTKACPEEDLHDILRLRLGEKRRKTCEQHVESSITLPVSFVDCPEIQYLLERGIRREWIREFDIRYGNVKDRWQGRVIFPVYGFDGNTVSAVGRTSIDRSPKWLNMPGTDLGKCLWPLFRNGDPVDFSGVTVLVEGILDALGVIASGHTALCTFGKKVSDEQLALLHKLGVSDVLLAWDSDALKQIGNALPRLARSFRSVRVFPFLNPLWKSHDCGDALIYPLVMDALRTELAMSPSVDSPEFIAWKVLASGM
jgi:hypothetical protein